jgi:Ca-activated chloride channel family protein
MTSPLDMLFPDLTFLAPERFALVVVPLALAALYLFRQRRRRAYVVRFTDPALLDSVAPKRPGLRRHVIAAAYLAATALLVIAAARPAMATEIPNEPVVVLAFDTSVSMEATDVTPSRIAAAREAAHRFIEVLPAGVRLGIVAFDGGARVVIPPTSEKVVLDRAIDRLSLGPGTAIGEAIHVSLDLLEQEAGVGGPDAEAGDADGSDAPAPGAIVLMSDGETTTGRPEGPAAEEAADRGVPISTIAFGTDSGTVTVDFMTVPVPVDKEALREIADKTGGKAFEAESAEEIASVFEDVGAGIGTRTEPKEVTDSLALAALVVAVIAAAGSLAWFARLP